MRSLSILVASFALVAPGLACLHLKGGITHDPFPGLSGTWNVEAVDNGVQVCNSESRIDQDGHYSM